jgi:hypothetical protein
MQFKNCQTGIVAGILSSQRAFVILFVCRLADILCKGQIRWDAIVDWLWSEKSKIDIRRSRTLSPMLLLLIDCGTW